MARQRSAVILSLVLLAGCTSGEDKIWKKGYDANFQSAYIEGWAAGASKELDAARKRGSEQAGQAINTGTAWQLYRPLAIWALIIGLLFGLLSQAIVLIAIRFSRQMPLLLVAAFVPGIRHCRAYSLLELNVQAGHYQMSLDIARQRRLWEIEVIQQVVTKKLMATNNLNELSQGRFVELAVKEIDRIVDAATRVHRSERRSRQPTNSFDCPLCGKRVKFSKHASEKPRQCPNPECGEIITFPKFIDSE